MSELMDRAAQVVERALALGAKEATASASSGTTITLTRRAGRVEQATEATTRRIGVALLVDDRYSSHSTSDLRPEALEAFLTRAVAATRFLEEDPDRALPPPELCGRGSTEAHLDQLDPRWNAYTAEDRARSAIDLEQAMDALRTDDVISHTVYVGDGYSRGARVTSNGFADETEGAGFSAGAEITLADTDGRRPEAAAYYSARYLSDLPTHGEMAAEAVRRAREMLGTKPIASGRYTVVLANRAAGRVLGTLAGPMSGGALHQGQSCLAGKLDERIGSDLLTIHDDPTIPRGLGSAPWDGDGLVARPRTIVEGGTLRSYNIGVYHGRKLGMAPTGGRSNWVIPPGDQSTASLLAALPKAVLITGFLGGNANGVTGDFSFGIRGMLLEHGKPVQGLSEMNLSGNTLSIFNQLVAVGDDPWTWSATRSPTLIFDDVSLSGT